MLELNNAPDKSRYVIYNAWKSGGAHVFVAEKVDGKIWFVDPQYNERDVIYYFQDSTDGSFGYCRIDNKPISAPPDTIRAAMRRRTDDDKV